jgi:hypothetical protein
VSSTAPRGWYPDPSGAPHQRYWDGKQWTGHAPPLPKRSESVLWITLSIVGAIVLFFGGCASLVAIASQSHKNSGSGSGQVAPPGKPVHDGTFEFVVSDVSTPPNWHGDPRPRGQWIIATVNVRNIDHEPQSFLAINQKLIDSGGRIYVADAMAAITLNNKSMVIAMKPGFNMTVKVPFDVPSGTVPATIELHDSVFSDGARVQVF